MPSLNWSVFTSLPGDVAKNFENLCRSLMRLHYGRYGHFMALANQPGVEFHLKLTECCSLGAPPRWFGWQCKYHTRTNNGDLRAASKKDIEESLKLSMELMPKMTDWILWTPFTLSKKDQDWFYNLTKDITLHLWALEELDTYLSGEGLLLRNTFFGDLILTADELEKRHLEAIQPIRDRWLVAVHQPVETERTIRKMLGEPGAWYEIIDIGENLRKYSVLFDQFLADTQELQDKIKVFVLACSSFSDMLLNFHDILTNGDLDIIQQKLNERKSFIDNTVRATPRFLRKFNLPISLEATNALDDMCIAQELLDDIEVSLGVGLVAVLADAGSGKTQMAAQLTSVQGGKPAGILLLGRNLQRGQSLNDLARSFLINGMPVVSIENLLASLDSAAKRSKCRLPIVIDGLNEAENPKDWKGPLETLKEMIKRYPNVLVVCTLRTGEHKRDEYAFSQAQVNERESFAVQALPSEIRKIECDGFGGNVQEAVKKYFIHYKIDTGDVEIPFDYLNHPLTLRAFFVRLLTQDGIQW